MGVWGTDFKFANATVQFSNMSLVIQYLNEHPELNVTLKYSTLSEYFDALYSSSIETGITFPTLNATAFTDGYNDFQYGAHRVDACPPVFPARIVIVFLSKLQVGRTR